MELNLNSGFCSLNAQSSTKRSLVPGGSVVLVGQCEHDTPDPWWEVLQSKWGNYILEMLTLSFFVNLESNQVIA